jgi:hypothetical protein
MTDNEKLCPKCGHKDEDHMRESWFDEEGVEGGVEGMTCVECWSSEGKRCQFMTWDWEEVLSGKAEPW